MVASQELQLDASELINGMTIGVAHFDHHCRLYSMNDQFAALLPLVGHSLVEGVTFDEVTAAADRCGQFKFSGSDSRSWQEQVQTAFELANGQTVELKRSDSQWLIFSCRPAGHGHRICNLVDISAQKRLNEFVAEFSAITGSRQIDSAQRLARMLLLGCEYLNLPTAAIMRDTEYGISVLATASPSGEINVDHASLYHRIDDGEDLTIEPLDPTAPDDELVSLLIGKNFRLDEGDLGCILFVGDHWGEGPITESDKQMVHLLADWTGQELARQSDQEQLERAYEELRIAATTDFLTKCLNRRHFLETAESSSNFHRRIDRNWAILMLDIDHFKSINDRFGHIAGDEALCVFANKVKAALRDHDLVGRYGGEEFTVFLYNTDVSGAAIVAERIRAAVACSEVVCGDIQFGMTVSIGLCPGDCAEELSVIQALERADQALYEAKAAGRNCVRHFAAKSKSLSESAVS